MFRSYLKTIFRNISGSKVYFFINVAGLCIGYTIFTLIMLFVVNELNYDTFNKKADRIYRVVELQRTAGAQVQRVAITMPAMGPALENAFPEIESTARFVLWPTVLCHVGDRRFYENGVSFADSSIFDIFTFHFVEGNKASALKQPNSIVIDQATARKYFGREDPMGKFIYVDGDFGVSAFEVSGVIRDFPKDSHLSFDMIASIDVLTNHLSYFSGWSDNDVVTYILTKRESELSNLNAKLPHFLQANLPPNLWKGLEIYLQPLNRVHLYSGQILYQINHNRGNINDVRLFSLIAFFVIFLACVNFINLTTARSAIRTREVGVRKLLGSYHSHLIYQFIGESTVISFVGLLLSFPLVEAILPTFNSMMGGRIIISYDNQFPFLAGLFVVAAVVGIIAGVYPAFYLSSFRPSDLLKGKFTSSNRGIFLRKVLIALQFAVAVGLVTATSIVVSQMRYMYNKPLGFNESNLMYIPLRDALSRNNIPLLRERLLRNPKILSVSAGEITGSGGTQGEVIATGTKGPSRLMVRKSYVDKGYIKAMGMKVISGSGFSPDNSRDSSAVLINEAMAKTLGWKDPVGHEIKMIGTGDMFSVVGVVRNFNYFSLRNRIDPLVMWLKPGLCRYLMIRISPADRESTIGYVRTTWTSLLPNHPFEYGFVSNYLDREYGNEQQSEHLLILFSLVAVVVACLGLFGLTLHTTEQRIKEIGIRKVLGASLTDIVFMLSRETIRLVVIACLVAWPVAYYFMNHWLSGFAYRISLDPLTFLISGLLVLLVAVFTLSFQAVKAGLSNPSEALRYE